MLARELARAVGIREGQLHEFANARKLPFAVSSVTGFYIKKRDLPQWRSASLGRKSRGW
jgi:hypothetical protein